MQYATYCPEDNKLRLYVGRVPREEYLALRAEGWTSTPKQDCDFVATWTPARKARALQYSDMIEDEDQSPEDRAADRAERFGNYRDKRLTESEGRADTYESRPMAHGFQSQARAERAAQRHDRIGDKASDSWSKAEYWQRRTAGVISHALYKSTPGVRMGRIKEIESQLRRWATEGSEWHTHLTLRLAYENQMLEAQGGRAAFIEMEVGGWIGKHQIRKVNKSNATGRVVSVTLKIQGNRWGNESKPGEYHFRVFNIERLPSDAYTPPTETGKAALAEVKADEKSKRVKIDCPLINPTDADAERLQAIWNAQYTGSHCGKPQSVVRLTQAQYSSNSGGTYSACETITLNEHGTKRASHYQMVSSDRASVCKVRSASGKYEGGYVARRVVILTDKPQKPLPFAKMEALRESFPSVESMTPKLPQISKELCKHWYNDMDKELIADACYVGFVSVQSMSQVYMTEKGQAALKALESEVKNEPALA